jgi:geranylgeranyl reductase
MTDRQIDTYDAVVIGGGPSGATAAEDLARLGHRVALIDKNGRIKPCGGAIPPRLIRDFQIPEELLCARIRSARMVSPTQRTVDMPIDGGFVGMVDREVFDEFLRSRAARTGATRITGTYERISRDGSLPEVHYTTPMGNPRSVLARLVIGADGALSKVCKQEVTEQRPKSVFAYHEIVKVPEGTDFDGTRCDVVYDGKTSPDFYGWVFPHGNTVSVGTGSAQKAFKLKSSVRALRKTPAASARSRRFAARGRPSRWSRSAAGTTAGTWCWPGTPPASSRPRAGRGSTTPWSGADWPPTPATRSSRRRTPGSSAARAGPS